MNSASMDLMRRFIDAHELRSGKRVVDVGSMDYNGSYRQLFTDGYIGADIYPGKNVDVIVGSPGWDSLAGADAVISGNTFEHVEDEAALLRKIWEILKPGGLLCVSAPSAGPVHYAPSWYRWYTKESMSAMIREAGFRVVSCEIDPDPDFLLCTCVAMKPKGGGMAKKRDNGIPGDDFTIGESVSMALTTHEPEAFSHPNGHPLVEEIVQYVNGLGSDSVSTFGGTWNGGARIQQRPEEIAPCIRKIFESGNAIRKYLEIGALAGGTTKLIHHFFKPETIVIIDSNVYPQSAIRKDVLDGIKRTELIGRSTDPEIIKQVVDLGHAYDLILVDGDHDYKSVRSDVDVFSKHISKGGFLLLHDTAFGDWGVITVMEEEKNNPAFKFLGEWQASGNPCGVALFQRV